VNANLPGLSDDYYVLTNNSITFNLKSIRKTRYSHNEVFEMGLQQTKVAFCILVQLYTLRTLWFKSRNSSNSLPAHLEIPGSSSVHQT
jgi:hypothetical protein